MQIYKPDYTGNISRNLAINRKIINLLIFNAIDNLIGRSKFFAVQVRKPYHTDFNMQQNSINTYYLK